MQGSPELNPRMEELVQNVYAFRTEFMRQFGGLGRRDIYTECGYEPQGYLSPELYYSIYRREPVAKRAVTLMPLECWKTTPEIVESDDHDRDTPFEQAVDALAKDLRGHQSWYTGQLGNPINEYLKRLHMQAGIGRFGVMMYGFDDGMPLDTPIAGILESSSDQKLKPGEADKLRSLNKLTQNESKAIARMSVGGSAGDRQARMERREALERSRQSTLGTDAQYFDYGEWGEQLADKPASEKTKLLFLRVYSEHLVQIVRWESDPTSPRFGKPLLYRITLNDPREQHTGIGLPLSTVFVHWSRVLHLPLNVESSEVLGVSTLEAILNPVYDVMKIRGGSGEMYWRGAFPGLSFETHPALGGDVPVDREKMKVEYENYMRGLERAMVTSGMTIKTLSPSISAPTEWLKVQMEAICIQLRCPMRVFLGSERGELASSQDDSQWNDQVREQQNSVCTPHIITPFYDRLIQVGVLPEPKDFKVEWPDLESLGDLAKAQVAVQRVTAITTYASGGGNQILPEKRFLIDEMGYKPDEAKAILDERDKDQESELKDAKATADEHGFEPTPPPGFQHPPPPPVAPGAKPMAPAKPPTGNYSTAAERAASLSDAATSQPDVMLLVNRAQATGMAVEYAERRLVDTLNAHTEAYNAHRAARRLCLNVDRIAEHKALETVHSERMEELAELVRKMGLVPKSGSTSNFNPNHGEGGKFASSEGVRAEPKTSPPPGPEHNPNVEHDGNRDGVTDAARVGVAGYSVPPPPPIGKLPNLTPHERQVETEFREAYEKNPDGLAAQFRAMAVATAKPGDPPTFGTDDAKMLHAAWAGHGLTQEQRAENRATLNCALHQTANAVCKRAFLQHLDTLQKGDSVMVTVGGCGAGKGFALGKVPEVLALKQSSKAVWDSAGDQNATENPWVQREAEKRGLKVTYAYVHADPYSQWAHPERGVVKRAGDPRDGRMVDANVFADSYAIGARNHDAFAKANADNPNARFVFLENGARTGAIPSIPKEALAYDSAKLAHFAQQAAKASAAPPHVKRGATVGERIWPQREGRVTFNANPYHDEQGRFSHGDAVADVRGALEKSSDREKLTRADIAEHLGKVGSLSKEQLGKVLKDAGFEHGEKSKPKMLKRYEKHLTAAHRAHESIEA